ncbi:potassium-transporting ATPase subunit KdpC [Microvirga brassicacearum]|uniref:Potassium-transporting ATPase KdpC subunit n=1 Tax=Microvirga brassicacearum TaxID=2580413 RepID=A0A5N3PGJ9_9HYPH|nr:potassium-transporting ATPase subunit KdpC [Microvirga brassicacearum]KAB0268856.1 potassium-transporting ATPase subunit KdpC [Microvirga brassicacearum]
MSYLRPAFVLLLLFTVLTGLAYPLAVTGLGQAFLSAQANGSLITQQDGLIAGSDLIGQRFTSGRYLWARPSATSAADPADQSRSVDAPYNAAASSGSNLGPTSRKLADRLTASAQAWNSSAMGAPIPGDALTTSGSGLDPHISPAFAMAQAGRIAAARGLAEPRVRQLIDASTEERTFGVFGQPRVNVLRVNRALDATGP